MGEVNDLLEVFKRNSASGCG